MPKTLHRTLHATLVLLLAATLLVPICASASDRMVLDITAPQTRKINIAVPWFANKNLAGSRQKFGSDLADILAKALVFQGIISVVPTSEYGGVQNADWHKLGADFTVLGQYTMTSTGLILEMRLLDVAGNAVMMGKSFSGTMEQKDQMLYKFCDEVISQLTGKPGIATSRIAFVGQVRNAKELFVTDILGKHLRQVTRHHSLVVSPRFTPDGNHMSYTSFHSGNPNLYITDLRQNTTTRALSRRRGMNFAPAWAPDGRHLILTLSYKGNPDLYLLNRQGQMLEQLTRNSGINVSPVYSPDGTRIAFVSDRSGKPQLYVMDLRSHKTQRITYEGSENAEPSWSPTEDLLVYSSLRNGLYQLCTIKPEQGATSTQITTDLSNHESPCWSPDGNQIIFSKRDGKKRQIWAIMKNGTFARRILPFEGNQTYPRWAR